MLAHLLCSGNVTPRIFPERTAVACPLCGRPEWIVPNRHSRLTSHHFTCGVSATGSSGWRLHKLSRVYSRIPLIASHIAGKDAQGDELDFAVFRFTLGIPGFDDAQLPKIVGLISLTLLAVNYLLTDSVSVSQVYGEVLGVALAAACIAIPTLGARLRQAQSGAIRPAEDLPGAAQIFKMDATLPDGLKQELAWASYALLSTTNVRGAVLQWRGAARLARGTLGPPAAASSDPLIVVSQALEQAAVSSPDLASVLAGGVASVYLPDRAALMRGGALDWPFLPRGTQCVLLQSLAPAAAGSASSEKGVYSESRTSLEGDAEKKQLSGGGAGGLMVLWSNEPRALTRRQRLWAAAIAAKLGSMLSKHDARRSAAPV